MSPRPKRFAANEDAKPERCPVDLLEGKLFPTFRDNLKRIMEKHDIKIRQLAHSIASTSPTKPQLTERTLKGYVGSLTTHAAKNPTIQSLEEISKGLRQVGLAVTESHLICRKNQFMNLPKDVDIVRAEQTAQTLQGMALITKATVMLLDGLEKQANEKLPERLKHVVLTTAALNYAKAVSEKCDEYTPEVMSRAMTLAEKEL